MLSGPNALGYNGMRNLSIGPTSSITVLATLTQKCQNSETTAQSVYKH